MNEQGLEFAGEGLREVCEALKPPLVWDFDICTCIVIIVTVAEVLAEKLGVDLP